MLSELFVVVVSLFYANGENSIDRKLKFLIDAHDITQPFQTIAYMCWSYDEILTAFKELPFQTQFVPIGELPSNSTDLKSAHFIMFLIDLRCNRAIQFMEDPRISGLYRRPYRWIIFGESRDKTPDIEALIDSDVLFVEQNYQLWNFYRIRPSFPYIFEYFGNWNDSGLHIAQRSLIISQRRNNLQKATLVASIVLTHPQSIDHLEDYREKHIDSIGKKDFIITKLLLETINATFVFNRCSTWGYYEPDTKNWGGMIGEVIAGRSDIAGTSMFIQANRIEVVDYISMVTPTIVSFIFREPPLSNVSNIYLLPFTNLVWFTAGCTVILAVLFIFMMLRIQKDSFQLDYSQKPFSRFTDCILVGVSAISQMGLILQPKSVSSRIISIFFLVALLFLYTSYTANIVAMLQSTAKTIVSLQDLLNSNLDVALDDNPYNRYYFSTATEPIRKRIYETKILTSKTGSFLNTSTGIELVRRGSFAFHVELGVAYELIEKTYYEHEKCNLKTIKYIQVVDPWYSIQKNSPFKEILKVQLFRIREYGIQEREHAKIYTKQPTCSTHGQNFGSVRLQECYGAFIILISGFGISIVLFLTEKFWRNARVCLI